MLDTMSATPAATVERLSVYLRTLEEARKEGHEYISSDEMGQRNGFTSAQVRKDLACFGNFGRKGKGYNIPVLISTLREILGVDHTWNVALFGLGHIGKAIVRFRGISDSVFHVKAIFDIDAALVGTEYEGIPIFHPKSLRELHKKYDFRIAIIAVPNSVAKETLHKVVTTGIKGILNFTETRFPLMEGFVMKTMNIGSELQTISYYLTSPDCACKELK